MANLQNMIKYSIIIPVYNVEKYIKQCIDSILTQSYTNYEIILVNDGSKDSSGLICDEYKKINTRIRVIHKPNGGLSSARNAGLDMAKGEYIIFLDSDDWWDDTNALLYIDKKLKEADDDILIFGMKKYFTSSRTYGDERPPILKRGEEISMENLMRNNIFIACACNKVVKHSLINRLNLRFRIGQLSEDIEWCAKLLLANPTINVLPTCFYVYRQQNPSSITATITRKNVEHVLDTIVRLTKTQMTVPLKHYLANQLVLLMSFSRKVEKNEIADLLDEMKKYWWLIKYNWYPYTRLVSKVRFLGFNNVRYLLSIYHKYKRGE